MADLDFEGNFLKNCLNQLNATLLNISDLNTGYLLCGKNGTNDRKRKEAVLSLQENPILLGEQDSDGFEPRIRFRIDVNDQNGKVKLLRICSKNAVSFPLSGTKNFFIAEVIY